jgi:hypothetical protein
MSYGERVLINSWIELVQVFIPKSKPKLEKSEMISYFKEKYHKAKRLTAWCH